MSSVRRGTRTACFEQWKHLDYMKRPYWKGERQAIKAEIEKGIEEHAEERIDREIDIAMGCTPETPCQMCRRRLVRCIDRRDR